MATQAEQVDLIVFKLTSILAEFESRAEVYSSQLITGLKHALNQAHSSFLFDEITKPYFDYLRTKPANDQIAAAELNKVIANYNEYLELSNMSALSKAYLNRAVLVLRLLAEIKNGKDPAEKLDGLDKKLTKHDIRILYSPVEDGTLKSMAQLMNRFGWQANLSEGAKFVNQAQRDLLEGRRLIAQLYPEKNNLR